MTVADINERKPRKPSNDATPRIYAAIAAVMAEVGKEGISKDRRNDQQGYKFRGIDDVFNALAPILAKHDLIVIPRVLSRELVERKNAKGNPLFYVTCQVEFTLVCSLDGSSIQAITYGEAMDSADKATNKAMSAAYKYMAMQTFCIPTEGDNDADATTHEVAPVAADRRPSPANPPAGQQRTVTNPATGRQIDPNNAKNSRDKWTRFQERVRSFTDLDELERWWADANTQAAIDQMPWGTEATEEYEKMQEALASAGAP